MNAIKDLDRLFDNRIRLGIMSALSVNDSVDFNYLKDLLEITDGNLASNIKALEKADYIKVEKIFIGKKPNIPKSFVSSSLDIRIQINARQFNLQK